MATWSYSENPNQTNRDKVRFLIGDTDTDDQLVFNEEIAAVLSDYGLTAGTAPTTDDTKNLLLASADIADALALKFARQVDTKNMSLSISKSQRAKAFKDCAKQLRGRAGVTVNANGNSAVLAEFFVGGLSVDDKQSIESDSDYIEPAFKRGQDDHTSGIDQDDRVNENFD
jgi:hypothetical protein